MVASILAVAALVGVTGQSPDPIAQPSTYVLLPQADVRQDAAYSDSFRSVSYWNTTKVAVAGDQVDVEIHVVYRGRNGLRPGQTTQHHRISCEWKLASQPAYEDNRSRPRFIDSGPLAAVAERACAPRVDAIDGPSFNTVEEVFDDAVRRLGYESAEAAMRLDVPAPAIVPGLPTDAWPEGERRQILRLVYGPDDDHRAVFLETSRSRSESTQRRSFWVRGVGLPRSEHVYAQREFQPNCAQGTLAFLPAQTWPQVRQRSESQAATPGAHAQPAGDASDALLRAVCDGSPDGLTLSSLEELRAYLYKPSQDPAFTLREWTTISHDEMVWRRTPDPSVIVAAFPADALAAGDKAKTTIRCIVSRSHELEECRPFSRSADRRLEEAHLSLAHQFVPARLDQRGRSTAGHTVSLSIEWSPARSRIALQAISADDMLWRRTPSLREIGQEYRLQEEASAGLKCEITNEYRLTDCQPTRFRPPHSGRALSDALLKLSPLFWAAPQARNGQITAGRSVELFFNWPQ